MKTLGLLILCTIFLSGCDIFSTRTPENPLNAGGIFTPPTSASLVIENLLKNAVQAIEAKNGQIDISTRTMSRNKMLIIVADNGKGMTKQIRRQIFDPGFTTKKRGWGLGLSLTKRIVEEYHKGKIKVVKSEIGIGTTMQMSFKKVS